MSLPRLLTRVCHSLLHLLRLVFFLFVFEFVPMFLFSVQMENGRTEKPIAAIVTWCRSFVLFGKWDWMTLHSGSCILHHVGCQCAECRHRFIIYQIERPKQILCTYPLWDMKLWQNETRKKNEKYEQRMHDPCKYLNCANEENGWMRRMCENDGEKTHPFQFPHNPANCRAANVPSWAFAKSISVHWIVRRSTIGMSKSIIPHRSLCRAERGEAGTHAPANASLFEWLWCLFAVTSKFSVASAPMSGRLLVIYNWAYLQRNLSPQPHLNRQRKRKCASRWRWGLPSDTLWRQRRSIPSVYEKESLRYGMFRTRAMFSILIKFIVAPSIISSIRMDWKREKNKINKNGNCECETQQST